MSDTSQGPGWWIASDGKWYPPHLHPDYRAPAPPTQRMEAPARRPEPEDVTATQWMPTPSSEPEPRLVRRPAKRTLGSDLGRLWHERRGPFIAVIVLGVLVLLGVAASLGGKDDEPTTLQSDITTTAPPAAVVQTTPTTAASTTTTTPATTTTAAPTTTVVSTTRAPTTTAAPVTTAATTPPTTEGAVVYANCAAVRAAGKAPLLRGQPGYRSGLDGDNDGVACE